MREVVPSHDLVQTIISDHAAGLHRLARRFSLCADDAQDAYQRAIEIFLRRADSLDPETAISWLRTVVKHEAMAVRGARLRVVGHEEVNLDLTEASSDPPPDEQALSADFTARSAEALQRLKPQEVRALLLKAEGHSYAEIGELCGWSYTKVNRCITEGRRAFLDRFAGIESGAECERWAPVLSAMADGEATADQLAQARPHLRNCPACRATLRDFHDVPREVGSVAPTLVVTGGLLGGLRAGWTAIRDTTASLLARTPLGEVVGVTAVGGGSGTLAAGGMKVAALCASVSIAAGGAYCLDQSGALPVDTPSAPQQDSAERPRPRPELRARPSVAQVDRDARRRTTTELAGTTSPTPRGEPRQPRPALDSATGAPEKQPDEPASGFTFESGDTGATRRQPSMAQPAQPPQPSSDPSEPAPPSGDFDGGGFE